MVKSGTRLKSQVCDTEVIVVKTAESLDDLRAGGAPMVPMTEPIVGDAHIDEAFAAGSVMGKRYVDGSGAEVLVTKAGAGTLSIGSTPMQIRAAAPLPASD